MEYPEYLAHIYESLPNGSEVRILYDLRGKVVSSWEIKDHLGETKSGKRLQLLNEKLVQEYHAPAIEPGELYWLAYPETTQSSPHDFDPTPITYIPLDNQQS